VSSPKKIETPFYKFQLPVHLAIITPSCAGRMVEARSDAGTNGYHKELTVELTARAGFQFRAAGDNSRGAQTEERLEFTCTIVQHGLQCLYEAIRVLPQ
jgi:hypothetical protein